jgi:hypothetical protein
VKRGVQSASGIVSGGAVGILDFGFVIFDSSISVSKLDAHSLHM